MEKAVVFGAGLSGLGAKELLEKKGYEVYLVDDKNGMPSSEAMELLDKEKIEFIVKSPGIPWKVELLVKAKDKNIKIISEIDLAYKYMDKNIKVISFTGTNGKTTTATKMYELLEYAGKKARLAGNAGFSFAKLVADEEDLEYIVLELSSYQLENNPQIHSHIAGIINLTPDHLARYDSVEEYYITKFNIFSRQTEQDFALINLDDEVFKKLYEEKELWKNIKSEKIYLSKEKKGNVFVMDGIIYTMKNLENMLFLIGAAKILGIPDEKTAEFLKTTKALEHRLENFFIKGKTVFINDSKGTNVESTLKAIDSFDDSIVLILGGDDKKISNRELVERIKERVDSVYLIGDNAPLLIKDMEEVGYKNYRNMETLENILDYFKKNMDFSKEQTVLFSPATSSFCQFKNFEHRGNVFKELTVKVLG